MNTSSFETPRPIPFHAMPSQPTNNNNSNNNQPVSTSGFAGKKSNKFFKQQQKQIHSLNFTTLFLMINQHKIIKKSFSIAAVPVWVPVLVLVLVPHQRNAFNVWRVNRYTYYWLDYQSEVLQLRWQQLREGIPQHIPQS